LRIATIIAFVLSLTIQVGFPLGVAIAYRRRTHAPWRVFFYGVIVYAVFQLFSWLPLSTHLDAVVGSRLEGETQAFFWMLGVAFTGSLVEELGRLWGVHYLFRTGGEPRSWRNGVMYGLGSAAVETMLLIAGLTFAYLVAYIAVSVLGPNGLAGPLGPGLTPGLRQALVELADTTWVQPLIVAFERVLSLTHQVAWALLIMQSLVSRQKRWFGYAVLYHASIAIIVPGLVRLSGYAAGEAVNAAFALISLWIILALRGTAEERGEP